MEKVTTRDGMLFVGQGEDTLAISILDAIEYKGENFVKIIAAPLMVDKTNNETLENAEFAHEILNGQEYYIEPVLEPELINALKNQLKLKNQKTVETVENQPGIA